jgi:hypothetical protein
MEDKQKQKSILSRKTQTIGEQIAEQFSITKIKNAVIQKVINTTANIYVITVDSRNKTQPIPFKRLKTPTTSGFKRVKKMKPIIQSFAPFIMQNTLFSEDIKLTPPVELVKFDNTLMRGSIFIFRDLIGENFVSKKNYGK